MEGLTYKNMTTFTATPAVRVITRAPADFQMKYFDAKEKQNKLQARQSISRCEIPGLYAVATFCTLTYSTVADGHGNTR